MQWVNQSQTATANQQDNDGFIMSRRFPGKRPRQRTRLKDTAKTTFVSHNNSRSFRSNMRETTRNDRHNRQLAKAEVVLPRHVIILTTTRTKTASQESGISMFRTSRSLKGGKNRSRGCHRLRIDKYAKQAKAD